MKDLGRAAAFTRQGAPSTLMLHAGGRYLQHRAGTPTSPATLVKIEQQAPQ